MIANSNISIEDNPIPISSTVKYLDSFIDQNLTFQREVKKVLRKLACGIKTLNAIKNTFNINTRLIIMNALVLSHLHCSSIILNSITQNLVASLDQQLSWTIKSCFNRRKFDSSRDLKFNIVFYRSDTFWTSNSYVISGGCLKIHSLRSKPCHSLVSRHLKIKERLDCQVRHGTSILENCVIKRGCKLWNSYHTKHPDSTSKYNYNRVKVKFQEYFYELFLEDSDTKVYGKLSWKEFRFIKN